MTGARLITAVCVAEVLTMTGVFAFPALLPVFFAEWGLTNTEAGWIAGVYFAGYAAGVPVLVALTDRVDARRVYIFGAVLAAVASAAFAAVAEGFWSALMLRAAAGVALGATYMPGLKVLVDRCAGPRQSHAVSFYTSSFSLGTAASFLLAGEVADAFGWRWAFAAAALAAMAAAIVLALAPVVPKRPAATGRLLDFRPVFANRAAMGYVLGYGAHCWELFTLRSWLVAFLAFALTFGGGDGWLAPTTIATLGALLAMAASIGGNELCVRFGRRRAITAMMLSSAAVALGFGFTAPLAYGLVVVLALAYGAAVQLDSAALTAGAVAAAEPDRRGATMAVHSLVGFGLAFVGPLVFGVILDAAGGAGRVLPWGLAFASVGVIGLLGPLALRLVPAGSDCLAPGKNSSRRNSTLGAHV